MSDKQGHKPQGGKTPDSNRHIGKQRKQDISYAIFDNLCVLASQKQPNTGYDEKRNIAAFMHPEQKYYRIYKNEEQIHS